MGARQMFTELPTGEVNHLSQAWAWRGSTHWSFSSPGVPGDHPSSPLFTLPSSPGQSHCFACLLVWVWLFFRQHPYLRLVMNSRSSSFHLPSTGITVVASVPGFMSH